MWYVQRADDNNWIVRTHSRSSSCFLVTLFSSKDNHHVSVAVVGDEHEDPYISLEEEVFQCSFWSIKPHLFMAQFLRDFVGLEDLELPVELVYRYGGLVRSRIIQVPTLGGLH